MNITKKKVSVLFIVLLILTTSITYFNILPNELFFDDEELIYKNIYIQNIRYLPRFFTENMIAGAGKVSNMYRPILLTSFSIDWNIWRGNPIGFHLTSVLLHLINTLLVYFLILLLFKDKVISLLTALLFSVHPAISEAIIYASGRTDPLYSMFTLFGIIFFLLFTKSDNALFYFFSFLSFILSLGSKETAVIAPLLMLLTFIIVKTKNLDKIQIKKIFLIFLPFFGLAILYVISRLTFLNFSNSLNFYTTETVYSSSLLVRALTFCRAFFDYALLLLFPTDLIIAREVSIITSLINPYVILFLCIVALLIVLMIITKNIFLLFAVLWFFLFLLPVSGLIPINNIIAEHYLYLPSIGFFLFLSYIFKKILINTSHVTRATYIASIFLILCTLSVRTIVRASDFRNPIVFYTKSLEQTPGHIPMMNNLAMAYDEKGEKIKAEELYKTIISQRDIYPHVHHNLGNLYKSEGKIHQAEEEYQKALQLDPTFIFSQNALKELKNKKISL